MRLIMFLSGLLLSKTMLAQNPFIPPSTEKKLVIDTVSGYYLTDPYQWLEDKTDPKVIAWTKAQHDYGEQYLKAIQKNYPGLREEITAYIDKDYEGPLNKQGKRVFQYIKKKGDKQSKLYTILDGKKTLIWDPVALDTTGKTAINSITYTYDGEKAAIGMQKSGSEISVGYIVDTRTGKILYGPLANVSGMAFTKDQHHIYFTSRSQEDVNAQRPLKKYYWKIGDPIENAVVIGTTNDPKSDFYIYDNRYSDVTFYGEGDFYTNTCSMRKTGTQEAGVVIYDSKQFQAYPEAIGDNLYILTNDNAPNKRFMVANKNKPEYKYWKTLIPEGETVLENVIVLKNKQLLVQDKKDIQSRLTLHDENGKKIQSISLPEIGNVGSVDYDREEDSIYLSISTFTSNGKVFVASPKDFKWRLYYSQPSVVDMRNITGSIQFYTSKDGTRVPCIVVHRKDIKLDGKNPVWLTGYGGFQIGISPGYYGYFASFINRGGIVVEAGIRGGDEYGEKWHENGMLANKQNCFDDFNACAEWLIKEKYTTPNRLLAQGGSNGGLLMGAIATQRPDLYKAIMCQVPLLDMIRYHKFLIARYWIPEYGNPDQMPDFSWILRYSPYHNIRMGVNVPTMLVTAGANDVRVDPLHAKKFVAALQNNPGQLNPVILHMDFESGHGSGKSTQQKIDEAVFEYEFIMNQLGM